MWFLNCGIGGLNIHDVTNVLNWTRVWRTWRTVHSIDASIMLKLLTHFSHTRLCIDQGGTWTHCTSVSSQDGLSSQYHWLIHGEFPPHTTTDLLIKVVVMFLHCCPLVPPSTSPGVLASFSWPSKLSCPSLHWRATLDELLYCVKLFLTRLVWSTHLMWSI